MYVVEVVRGQVVLKLFDRMGRVERSEIFDPDFAEVCAAELMRAAAIAREQAKDCDQ